MSDLVPDLLLVVAAMIVNIMIVIHQGMIFVIMAQGMTHTGKVHIFIECVLDLLCM